MTFQFEKVDPLQRSLGNIGLEYSLKGEEGGRLLEAPTDHKCQVQHKSVSANEDPRCPSLTWGQFPNPSYYPLPRLTEARNRTRSTTWPESKNIKKTVVSLFSGDCQSNLRWGHSWARMLPQLSRVRSLIANSACISRSFRPNWHNQHFFIFTQTWRGD